MTTTKPTPKPKTAAPQDRKPKAAKNAKATTPTPSEVIEEDLRQQEIREELLGDMPALREPHRFRLGHRNTFANLLLDAMKTGVFDGDSEGMLEFDLESADPKEIERLQKFNAFVVGIDEWAESIAVDPEAYAVWAQGKTQEHFMALFMEYRDALGESNSSGS